MTETPDLSALYPLTIGGKLADMRTKPAQRYKSLCADLVAEVGDTPAIGQAMLIARAAGLTVQLEMAEAGLVNGKSPDVQEYTNLTRTLGAVLKQLGLDQKAKAMKPVTLDAHARAVIEGSE